MFGFHVSFQIEDDTAAYILIESDTREGCLDKVGDFLRNVFGACSYFSGAGGIVETLFIAQRAGYTVYAGNGKDFTRYWHRCDAEDFNCIGDIERWCHRGGDDTFSIGTRDVGWVIKDTEVSREYWDDETGMPDFAAIADKFAEATSAG